MSAPETVRRYGRIGRWFHAGIYVTVLVLLASGWWFLIAGYHRRSPPTSPAACGPAGSPSTATHPPIKE